MVDALNNWWKDVGFNVVIVNMLSRAKHCHCLSLIMSIQPLEETPNFLSPCSLHARETEVRFGSYNKLYFAFTIPLSSFLVLNLKSIVFINTCMTCMVLELACNSCPGICIKGVCKAGIQSQGTSYPWRNGHWWAQIGTFFVMLLIVYIKKNISQRGKTDEILKWCAAIFTRFQLVRRVLFFSRILLHG